MAIHALTVLSVHDDPVSSARIAESVNTNPVVVRRVLGSLVEEGIVASIPGKNGGFKLGKKPSQIRLRDVLRAIGDESVFKIHENAENPKCYVSRGIKHALANTFERVDAAVNRELQRASLADVLKKVQANR